MVVGRNAGSTNVLQALLVEAFVWLTAVESDVKVMAVLKALRQVDTAGYMEEERNAGIRDAQSELKVEGLVFRMVRYSDSMTPFTRLKFLCCRRRKAMPICQLQQSCAV